MTKPQCFIAIQLHHFSMRMNLRKYLTLCLMKCYLHEMLNTLSFRTKKLFFNWWTKTWHWLWHFAQIIVQGPWAKVARRCRRPCPWLGRQLPTPEKKRLRVIYSRRPYFVWYKELKTVLHWFQSLCCTKTKEEKERILFFTFLLKSRDWLKTPFGSF